MVDPGVIRKRLGSATLALLLILGTVLGRPAGVLAALPQGNAVTDPAAILRDALPVKAPDLQDLQHRLEGTSDDLRAKRWSALTSSVRRSQSLLATRRLAILAEFSDTERPQA
jgi:peptidylprolyl isomerase